MIDAWKQEKFMRLYDARKKLLSRVETAFKLAVEARVTLSIKCFINSRKLFNYDIIIT